MQRYFCLSVMVAMVFAITASAVSAGITLDMVTVGNAGNANDTTGYGGVGYTYQIGKYEVTTSQYTAFLNAVARTDTYGLYSTQMWNNSVGCKIFRSGVSGNYSYSVAPDRANRPVNYVSWGDSARFANWLHNGQGSGNTEDGAYTFNGATTREHLMSVSRNANAQFWIPSENEWYKAAYHKNDGLTGNYWAWPTGTDNIPSNRLFDIDPGNNANFVGPYYTIGSPYYMTEVGDFDNSESPYGAFDQGGNVAEWNDTAVSNERRGSRGGSWDFNEGSLRSTFNGVSSFPEEESAAYGFRVASVPEPGSFTLMLCGASGVLYWWRRRK